MKKIKRFLFIFFALFLFSGYSQISGNKVYGYNNYHSLDASKTLQSIQSTDSTLIISSRILLHKAADFYFVSLGVNDPTIGIQYVLKLSLVYEMAD